MKIESRGVIHDDELRDVVESYLTDNGWSETECPCETRFFYKRGNDGRCQSEACRSEFEFLENPERNQFLELGDLRRIVADELDARGFTDLPAKSVDNDDGTTYLTVAGIQIIDDILFGDATEQRAGYVFQPVVRTGGPAAEGNGLRSITENPTYATSFINLAHVETEPSPPDLAEYVDLWLDVLSECGLFVSDCTILPHTFANDWGEGAFTSYGVEICYEGLEVGELVYAKDVPCSDGRRISFIDCGFGFERLAWAVNSNPRYFDHLAPLPNVVADPIPVLDLVRTLTLMAGCGVLPAKSGAGYRFRQLSKELARVDKSRRFETLIRDFHEFWTEYVEMLPVETVRKRVMAEYQRNLNRSLSDANNVPKYAQRTDDFVTHLLKHGNSMSEVRALLESDTDE